jgi:hypothetical protein
MKKWSGVSEAFTSAGLDLDLLDAFGPSAFHLSRGDKIFTIGSCFARNIEDSLIKHELFFPIMHYQPQPDEFGGPRPRGILNKFTPGCMLEDILWVNSIILDEKSFEKETRDRFFFPVDNGLVVDLGLQAYVPVTEARFWQRRMDILALYKQIAECKASILTFGLVEQWYFKGRVIQHAPVIKEMLQARQDFSFSFLNDVEIRQTLEQIIQAMRRMNPDLMIIFTVSPVPLLSTFSNYHVLLANNLSKSRLLTAAHFFVNSYQGVEYFPSFDIVQLFGRDGFESDMRHVKDSVVQDICMNFAKKYLVDVRGPENPNGVG